VSHKFKVGDNVGKVVDTRVITALISIAEVQFDTLLTPYYVFSNGVKIQAEVVDEQYKLMEDIHKEYPELFL